MEVRKSLDNKIKKNFYKKALNSYLTITVLNIDGIGTFETYKTWLIIMDDCIVRYNANYKRFSFKTSSKSKTINPIIESVKEDILY